MSRQLNFDHLARPYRWLEYATFGRTLEHCRLHFLPALTGARRALVLGDGDGRFLARLLQANPQIEADVVDISPAMLRLARQRLDPDARRRVAFHQADLRAFVPPNSGYDLVISHFFLDCLFPPELAALVDQITPRITPGAFWIVSEFAQPQGGIRHAMARRIVSALYMAFGLLTGLQVRSLPDHSTVLKGRGFFLRSEKTWLGGLLMSQLWRNTAEKCYTTPSAHPSSIPAGELWHHRIRCHAGYFPKSIHSLAWTMALGKNRSRHTAKIPIRWRCLKQS